MKASKVLRRILESLFILLCIITINFILIRFMPGDPLRHLVGEEEYLYLRARAPEVLDEIRAEYGLDKPLIAQFASYVGKTLRFDFGISYKQKQSVLEIVTYRMGWTLKLAIPAILLSAFFGGALGLYAGWKKGGWLDTVCSPLMLFLNTLPSNCLAILFLFVFAFRLRMFPIGGMTSGGLEGLDRIVDILWHMVLPLSVLVILRTSSHYMLMKSTVRDICNEEYVITARSKGFTKWETLCRHVLKNAICPYLTSVCMQFGYILSGSMLIEVVFSWKGMGTLIYDAVNSKDYPVLQACFFLIGVCVVFFNLLADALNLIIDPRIREDGTHE